MAPIFLERLEQQPQGPGNRMGDDYPSLYWGWHEGITRAVVPELRGKLPSCVYPIDIVHNHHDILLGLSRQAMTSM